MYTVHTLYVLCVLCALRVLYVLYVLCVLYVQSCGVQSVLDIMVSCVCLWADFSTQEPGGPNDECCQGNN